MHLLEPPVNQAAPDRTVADSASHELPARDLATLGGGDLLDAHIDPQSDIDSYPPMSDELHRPERRALGFRQFLAPVARSGPRSARNRRFTHTHQSPAQPKLPLPRPKLAPMTVNLTRIYTRLGDSGETHLGDMSRVPKTHPRIEAYGTVDELNAHIGLALTIDDLPEQYVPWLQRVQNDLFDVGADIAAPEDPDSQRERLRVIPAQTEWLEQRCDEVNATLAPLKSFVLPGGTAAAAQLHVCRTVCRRAERLAIAGGEELNPEVVRYLNRLSDLLFILSRGANGGDEPLWEPGKYR